jgi:hypothetical protein
MLDIKIFQFLKTNLAFDFKGLLIKWKLLEMVLLSLIITFTIAYQYSQGKVYSMETLISVRKKAIRCLRQTESYF